MPITSFYNKTVNTTRLTNIGGGSHRQDWQASLTGIAAAIHPVNPEVVAVQGNAFYNMFKMFCAVDLDIEIDDRVIDGSTTYTVTGKMLYDDAGTNQHMKLTLVKGV